MADTARRKITRRSEANSDVADSGPFRKRLEDLTEGEFGRALLAEVRAARGNLAVRKLSQEWLTSGEGLVYEITAEVEPLEE